MDSRLLGYEKGFCTSSTDIFEQRQPSLYKKKRTEIGISVQHKNANPFASLQSRDSHAADVNARMDSRLLGYEKGFRTSSTDIFEQRQPSLNKLKRRTEIGISVQHIKL